MNLKQHLQIYLIADYSYGLDKIEEAIKAGVTIVQLREKNISSRLYLERAIELRALTRKYQIPLIINDRWDIALLCKADGVHLGQSDLPIAAVRQLTNDEFIIGATTKTPELALQAEKEGANYVGCGAWFTTSTKLDATPLSIHTYQAIRHSITVPTVAIGGINTTNCHIPISHGANGIALSNGILNSEDITATVNALRLAWHRNK